MLKLLKQTNKTKIFFQQVKIRCALSKRKFTFSATDFGAGTKGKTNRNKKISEILKRESLPLVALIPFIIFLRVKRIKIVLELGTSLGLTAATIAAIAEVNVKTIEGDPVLVKYAKFVAKKLNVDNKVEVINGRFEKILPDLLKSEQFDLVFIDGNHTYEATKKYFEMIRTTQAQGTIVVFDDINWSAGMRQAWKEIQKAPGTKVIFNFVRTGIIKIEKK